MELTVMEYFKQMTEGMNFFQKVWFLVTDTFSAFSRLSFFDGLVYAIILLTFVFLIAWIVLFIYVKILSVRLYFKDKKELSVKKKEHKKKENVSVRETSETPTAEIIQFKPRK